MTTTQLKYFEKRLEYAKDFMFVYIDTKMLQELLDSYNELVAEVKWYETD